MVGKSKQTIPEANLQPILAFDEPFGRIIIDCVSPLPNTKSGCQYLWTIMYSSTRLPEAIPISRLNNFTLVGHPKSSNQIRVPVLCQEHFSK